MPNLNHSSGPREIELNDASGSPGASSRYVWDVSPDRYKAKDAFGDRNSLWGSAYGVLPPHLIWFNFIESQRPAKISFFPRQDDLKYAMQSTPTQFQIIGSDECSSWADLTDVVHFDPATSLNDERSVDVERSIPISRAYRCIGLRILAGGNPNVALSLFRMWVWDGN